MSHFADQSTLYNQPLLLSKEQIQDPFGVIDEFFWDYHLGDVRLMELDKTETCLISEEHPFCEAKNRADLLYYQKKLVTLLEAAYVIRQQRASFGMPKEGG